MRYQSLLLVIATSVVGLCQSAHAQNYPEVLFVFDASGSMLGSAGSTTKIVAAKKVMQQIISELNPEIRVGLVAYGHRRERDCRDIEVLIRPGSTDRNALLQKVQSLQPRGMTPISDALSISIDLLKLKENETTIILVSDGKETCQANPCDVVKKLKATGIKFVLHVVGFQVDQTARKQLECLAEKGGGTYFHAGNSDALLKSLQKIGEQMEPMVAKAKTENVPKKSGLGRIVLSQPKSATVSMGGLRIVRSKDEKVIKSTKRLPQTSNHLLPDGEYEVYYLYAQPNFGKPTQTKLGTVQVKRGSETKIAMGAIAFNIEKTLEENVPVTQVLIVESGTQQPTVIVNDNRNGFYNFTPKAVLPGVYDVKIVYSRTKNSQPTVIARKVSVAAGKTTTVTVNSGIRLKPAAANAVTGWDLIPHQTVVETNKGEGKPDKLAPILQPRRGGDNQFPLWQAFAVPPGRYRLMVYIKGMDEPLPLDDDLQIKAGQLIEYDTGL